MEATKAKLEQAQAAPQSQRAQILAGMTGENLTGDMLTATIWSYFASLQSYGGISGAQAGMIDLPGLQYGLFHAQVQPRKLYGIVTTGISFKGLNMDVGHVRSVRWVKDDNPQSQINSDPNLTKNGKTAAQNRWIAYNKDKGQYSSAMEHATPEQFWVDKSQCKYTDDNGVIQNPAKADCAQGISAVKAIAIAQSQGQKIYTINPQNRDTALPKLTLSGSAGEEIRSAINSGKEVTFHESSINAYGWHGVGYSIVDPDTGAGAYLIEGAGNGGVLLTIVQQLIYAILFISIVAGAAALLFLLMLLAAFIALAIPVLAVMFVSLSLSIKLLIVGLGVWTASEVLLTGCAKSIGKLIGSIVQGLPAGSSRLLALLLGVETFKAILEGC